MIQCKKCQSEKLESYMKIRGGKPSKVCIACDQAAATERAAERERLAKIVQQAKGETVHGRKHKKKRKAAAPRARKVEAAEPEQDRIKIEAGLGVDAFLTDDGRLQLSQDDDNVVLSRTEAKVVFAQFNEWVNEEAA